MGYWNDGVRGFSMTFFPLSFSVHLLYLPANEHNDCERELGITGFIVLNRNLLCQTDASLSISIFFSVSVILFLLDYLVSGDKESIFIFPPFHPPGHQTNLMGESLRLPPFRASQRRPYCWDK